MKNEDLKIVAIAEKPSVARAIATVLGAKNKEDGYFYGNGYAVTWAFGHLVGLALPEDYGIAGFQRESLPIIPTEWKLVPRRVKSGKEYKADPGALKQLKVIKELFSGADRIICSTDAGREGEAIFRFIYNYIGCRKRVERLWISSLTERAIREGFEHLKPGENYDNLYEAAFARSKSDWLVGLNGSQALTVSAGGGVYSLGRVQTPTLVMICHRYKENKGFTPQKYVQLKLSLLKDGQGFAATSDEKYPGIDEASPEAERIYQAGIATVKEVTEKEVTEAAPLLYDLTTLQKEANKRYGYTAQETLDIAQALYEKKLATYPRTGSRYIPDDVFDEIKTLGEVLSLNEELKGYAALLSSPNINKRSVNASKVTDHHALLITENQPSGLSEKEQRIYQMIAIRILEAFSPSCIKHSIVVSLDARESVFTCRSIQISDWGWRAIRAEESDNEAEEKSGELPPLSQNDTCEIQSVELLEKQTKPKALYTDSSLLSAMESAGKDLVNDDERAAMKEVGIGTPATRAAIIETLFTRGYINREKKSLIPTDKGLAVFEIVKDKKIADVEMTGMWESALSKIENGEMDASSFQKTIEIYATQITTELLETSVVNHSNENVLVCPKCGKGTIRVYPKVAKCNEADCGLTIFREICGKQLSEKQIVMLVTKEKTDVIKGLKGKSGKSFDAALRFDEQYKVIFQFPDNKKKR